MVYSKIIANEYAKNYSSDYYEITETSGNTISNSTRTRTGTITNGVLNGESVALNSGFIQMNSNLPVGDKSFLITFRVDNTSQTNMLLSNSTNLSGNKNGYGFVISSTGNISIWFFRSTSGVPTQTFSTTPKEPIQLGKIYNLLVTFKGNIIKVYLDDLYNPINTFTRTQSEPSSFNTLFIGKENISTVSYQYPFTGHIYHFSIYDSDISDKSLDKTLILSVGAYKKWDENTSTWTTISTSLPTTEQFLEHGMDDLSVLDRKLTTLNLPTSGGQVSGNGKVYKATIDLKKIIDLKSISLE